MFIKEEGIPSAPLEEVISQFCWQDIFLGTIISYTWDDCGNNKICFCYFFSFISKASSCLRNNGTNVYSFLKQLTFIISKVHAWVGHGDTETLPSCPETFCLSYFGHHVILALMSDIWLSHPPSFGILLLFSSTYTFTLFLPNSHP